MEAGPESQETELLVELPESELVLQRWKLEPEDWTSTRLRAAKSALSLETQSIELVG